MVEYRMNMKCIIVSLNIVMIAIFKTLKYFRNGNLCFQNALNEANIKIKFNDSVNVDREIHLLL